MRLKGGVKEFFRGEKWDHNACMLELGSFEKWGHMARPSVQSLATV